MKIYAFFCMQIGCIANKMHVLLMIDRRDVDEWIEIFSI